MTGTTQIKTNEELNFIYADNDRRFDMIMQLSDFLKIHYEVEYEEVRDWKNYTQNFFKDVGYTDSVEYTHYIIHRLLVNDKEQLANWIISLAPQGNIAEVNCEEFQNDIEDDLNLFKILRQFKNNIESCYTMPVLILSPDEMETINTSFEEEVEILNSHFSKILSFSFHV